MHNSLSQAALKATTKAIRSKQNAGSTRPIMAIFYDLHKCGSALGIKWLQAKVINQ